MTPKEVTQKEALVSVTKTVLGKPKERAKKIKIRPFVTDTATVAVKYGATINTGDYESTRIDVFLSCPCYKEEMVDVYNNLAEIADKLMEKEVAELKGE